MSTVTESYLSAKQVYAQLGVDTDAALEKLKSIPVSVHCWQLDDLTGFENFDSVLSGGIQTTGSAPGKPRSVEEYFKHLDMAISLIPGKIKLALHACYPICEGPVSRDELRPEQFSPWLDYAKQRGVGLDFNPTYFSHPMAQSGLTLTSEDSGVREYWIRHGISCRKIGAYFGRELGQTCITNHWIGDGSKDYRVDKLGPRERLIESLDAIFAEEIPAEYNIDSLESKLFGLGVESFTPGSHEFYTNYAMNRNNCIVCLDTGHFHPTESIADKLSAYLCFGRQLMLHVSRPVRWDSDHVVSFNDETREVMLEIARHDAFDAVHIGTDYFDASINRIAATVLGTRNVKKAILYALLEPTDALTRCEARGDFTKRLAYLEEQKSLPFGAVWERFCEFHNMPAYNWIDEI